MFARSLALAALCGMSFAASAVTVDLRHEFIDGGSRTRATPTAFPSPIVLITALASPLKRSGNRVAITPVSLIRMLSVMVMKRPLAGAGRRIRTSR